MSHPKSHLYMWKEIWDIFVSDTPFRQFYTNKKVYDLTLEKNNTNTPIKTKAGTLYIPIDKFQGHFLAFEQNNNKIHIFDPSRYGFAQFRDIPGLQQSVINRSKKTIETISNHPQDHCPGDTFCQTWSLAWLNNKLRPLTKAKNKNESINAIYEIVRHISRSVKFVKYMLHNQKI